MSSCASLETTAPSKPTAREQGRNKAGVAGQPDHLCRGWPRLAEAGRGGLRLEAALRLTWGCWRAWRRNGALRLIWRGRGAEGRGGARRGQAGPGGARREAALSLIWRWGWLRLIWRWRGTGGSKLEGESAGRSLSLMGSQRLMAAGFPQRWDPSARVAALLVAAGADR